VSRRTYFVLFAVGLAVNLLVAAFEHSAGYMDADYYYAGGIRLAQGQGFTEFAVWNYLSDPRALPAPSHGYWYPLASILAAAGMIITRSTSYASARIAFLLVAALVPPLTAAVAFRLTHRFDLSLAAGLLALLPTYFTAFIPVTDNYGLYMVLGAGFFLLTDRAMTPGGSRLALVCAGLCVGLMNLARSDGLLWILAGLLFIGLRARAYLPSGRNDANVRAALAQVGPFLGGYLLVMLPWFGRNYATWGSALAPGGGRALMLRTYTDTFAYPASRLSLSYLLGAGWSELILARLHALLANLDATGNLQISLVLLHFAVLGLWMLRHETIVQVGIAIWLVLLGVMSLLFPFAGPRGSFTHASSALYSLWWTGAVAGIGGVLAWAERRGWTALGQRKNLVLFGVVVLNSLFSVYLAYSRIGVLDWDRFARVYGQVEAVVAADGALPDTPIVVADPPAYFTANRRPAIVLPAEDSSAIVTLAEEFGARYLVLEGAYLRSPSLQRLYEHPTSDPTFAYIGQAEDAKIYRIGR
jgi:hypothetical protein